MTTRCQPGHCARVLASRRALQHLNIVHGRFEEQTTATHKATHCCLKQKVKATPALLRSEQKACPLSTAAADRLHCTQPLDSGPQTPTDEQKHRSSMQAAQEPVSMHAATAAWGRQGSHVTPTSNIHVQEKNTLTQTYPKQTSCTTQAAASASSIRGGWVAPAT